MRYAADCARVCPKLHEISATLLTSNHFIVGIPSCIP